MSETLRPARVLAPGVTLKRELEARGWTQKDLAKIIARPEQAISEIVTAEKRITPETAIAFASAFGTSAEFWLNLQSNYDLWQAQRNPSAATTDLIRRRAKLFERAPIAELVRRGWLKKTESLQSLEREVLRFLGISSLDEPCGIAASFRLSEARSPESASVIAWLKRVDAVARTKRSSRPFKSDALESSLAELLAFSSTAAGAPKALDWLAERGVALAIVKHLPKTFIDGVSYLRDDGTPVIALSLRHDRIDAFWFTLLHELAHLLLGHPGSHVDNLSDHDHLPPQERQANAFAQEKLVPRARLQTWLDERLQIRRTDLAVFAEELGRAPGIVLGQLQHRGAVPFSRYRDLLVPVSDALDDWITK